MRAVLHDGEDWNDVIYKDTTEFCKNSWKAVHYLELISVSALEHEETINVAVVCNF